MSRAIWRCPISGKDSLATFMIARHLYKDVEIEPYFVDVEAELPETYEWLDKVERELGIKITRISRSLIHVMYDQGFLPGPKTRYCTRKTKLPGAEEISGSNSIVMLIGLRSDEADRTGYNPTNPNIEVRYPLQEAGIDLAGVYTIVNAKGLKPPTFFWQTMYDMVLKMCGNDPEIIRVIESLPEWVFDRLFAGRTRNNCFFCFFQKIIEWIWLHETHPELFEQSQVLETDLGSGDRRQDRCDVEVDQGLFHNELPSTITVNKDPGYYFIGKGRPLSSILKKKDHYIRKRAKEILKLLQQAANRKGGFIPYEHDAMDIFGYQKSCGFMCGK